MKGLSTRSQVTLLRAIFNYMFTNGKKKVHDKGDDERIAKAKAKRIRKDKARLNEGDL